MGITAGVVGVVLTMATEQVERISIACVQKPTPQLIVIGSPDVLNGKRAVELPPGVGFFRSLFIRESLAMSTVSADDESGSLCRLRENHLIAIERVSAGPAFSCIEPWSFAPILAKDKDIFVLPHEGDGEINGTLLTASQILSPVCALFRLIDLTGNYRPSEPFTIRFQPIGHDLPVRKARKYICPMRCEDEKTYEEPIICPKCGMKLQDTMSHMDHSPRHGGTFFMSPDGLHHLEGVLMAGREFRLYGYDEFTRPIDSATISAVGAAKTSGDANELTFVLDRASSGEYLTGRIDPAVTFPIALKVRVTFAGSHEPSVYDFDLNEK